MTDGSCGGLVLQRAGEPGGLGERLVEQPHRVAERGQQRARHLGEQDLARLEVGELADLVGR